MCINGALWGTTPGSDTLLNNGFGHTKVYWFTPPLVDLDCAMPCACAHPLHRALQHSLTTPLYVWTMP